jgi:hypothetical protein
MSDAYICDRCDKVTKEAAGGIVTNLDSVGGNMRSEVKSIDKGPASRGTVGSSLGPTQIRETEDVTTWRPQWADLCEECVEDLKEWWAAKE